MAKGNRDRDKFTQIPNMVLDMGLSPSAERLYIHIKRVTGDDGLCWQSQDTLAINCRMSTKTIIRSKRELENAGLIKITSEKINKFKSHVIKIINIWDLNNSFHKVKKERCGIKRTPRRKRDTDIGVKEVPHAISEAVENNHPKNIPIINIPSNNIPDEFVLEIPGQLNNVNNINNEHERTPGAVAVMQIDRASPGEELKTLPRSSQYTSLSVDPGKPVINGETHDPTSDLIAPTKPCVNCGCTDYWLTGWNQRLCSTCHPKPKGSN